MTSFRSYVEEVRARSDLVEVIGTDVELRRAGRVLQGLSPFHEERHASFVVWPDTQTWHDFSGGGGLGGDVFAYVQERRRCDFKEAVQWLAERAGVRRPGGDPAEHDRELGLAMEQRAVRRLLGLAAAYFHRRLPPELRDAWYRKRYGFTDTTIDSLQLGWADGQLYEHFVRELGVSEEQALRTGLFVRTEHGPRDFFRGRLTFPYWRGGEVVYFTARTVEADAKQGKYWKLLTRSDRHPYVSSTVRNEHLFNEDALRRAEEVLITEGIPDCIAAHQAGFACASPGTTQLRDADVPRVVALTRSATLVILCNDAEESGAGFKGALASADALTRAGRHVRIAALPRPPAVEKLDLDDFLKAHTPEELRQVLARATPYAQCLLEAIPEGTPKSELGGRLAPLLEVLALLPPLERDDYLERIPKRFGIRKRALAEMMPRGSATPPAAPVEPAPERPKRPPRPRIVIDTDEDRVVDEAIAALATVQGVFCRGSLLVHVIGDARPGAPPPRIVPLGTAGIRDRMVHGAEWVSLVPSERGPVEYPAHPPSWAAPAIEARKCWPGVPAIEGVVDSPVLRPDGSVLESPGYDAPSRLLFIPSGDFPAVPASPTREEAAAAAARVLEVVCDFPFQDGAHRSAWLAGLLTPLARAAFDGPAPLFLVDANVRGAGKTKLVDVIAEVVLGGPMPRSPPTRDATEEAKRITAIALEGDRMVLIDNVDAAFGSAPLIMALTATVWQERLLGKNERVCLPLLATWYATGNNVALRSDMPRRCLHIRLDSSLEKPEDRDGFRHANLLAHVRAERPRLLVDALTILRAYCAAGRPPVELRPWGSYEGWSALVRAALVWCGLEDPVATRAGLDQVDSDATSLGDVLVGWEELTRTIGKPGGVTAAQAVRALDDRPKELQRLRDALAELGIGGTGKPASPRAVGNLLRRFRGRAVGDRKLEFRLYAGERLWFAAPAGGSGGSAGPRATTAAEHSHQLNLAELNNDWTTGGSGDSSIRSLIGIEGSIAEKTITLPDRYGPETETPTATEPPELDIPPGWVVEEL